MTVEAQRNHLAAIVLAGGNSSRMGQDKALLQVNGMPLLRRVCQVAQQCANPVYVVTAWVERYREMVPDCQFVLEGGGDRHWQPQGPLVGFAQGLAQMQRDSLQPEWVLLLACDLPRLRAEALEGAIAQLPAVSPGAIAFLPLHNQRWEPLCGFYRGSCLGELQRFVEAGGRSFQRWLTTQSVAELHLTDPSILFNCNTPDDLAQIGLDRD